MAKQIDDETMENVCILAKLSLTEEEKLSLIHIPSPRDKRQSRMPSSA